MVQRLVLVISLACLVPASHASSQVERRSDVARFEAASIKPNTSGDFAVEMRIAPGGRFSATNVPPKELIRVAYGVQKFQIVGGPRWIETDRVDVVATMGTASSRELASVMLQALLADRFDLRIRREMQARPIYKLVKAKKDEQLVGALHLSTVDCRALAAAARARGEAPAPPPAAGQPMRCGIRSGRGHISAAGVTMDEFSRALSLAVQRVVKDDTGLSGTFDAELNWRPDTLAPTSSADLERPSPDFPSLFTALQEQLALRLEPATGLIEMLIVDRIGRPTPD